MMLVLPIFYVPSMDEIEIYCNQLFLAVSFDVANCFFPVK